MGLAIYRTDPTGEEEALPSHAVQGIQDRAHEGEERETPADTQAVYAHIQNAKQPIPFLAVYSALLVSRTGSPKRKTNAKLFVRGCVTNPLASEGFYYHYQCEKRR